LLGLVKDSDKPYVLFNFYNTSCKPCVQEIRELAELINHPHKHLNVYFIAWEGEDSSAKELDKFLKKLQIETPLYSVNTETLDTFLSKHRISNQSNTPPLSLILSRDGRLVKRLNTLTGAHEVDMIIHKDESFGI